MDVKTCNHQDQIKPVTASSEICEECKKSGGITVELRMCLTCGNVGCCDSSPGKHATAHFKTTGHPIMQAFKAGKDWRWCYIDEVTL